MDPFTSDETQVSETTKQAPRVPRPDKENVPQPEPVSPPEEPEAQPSRHRRRSPFGYLLLWLLATVSLLINVVFLRQFVRAWQFAQQAVDEAIVVLDDIQEHTFSTTVLVDETLMVDTDTPLNETIPVVIDQDLPIDVVVTVPVDAGLLGTFELDVPINTVIPVYLEQDIVIDQPFRIQAAVPIHFEVPVEVSVTDLGLSGTFEELQARLIELSDQLANPLSGVSLSR